MLIKNQTVKVRVTNYNERHFKNLGYNFIKNDYLIVPVEHLTNGSGIRVNVKCQYCDKIFKKQWRRYRETKLNTCCNKCKKLKMMETSMARYGNICSLRNEEILKKSKKTTNSKFGVDYPFQNKEILRKCRESTVQNNNDGYRNGRISSQQIYLHKLYGGKINYSEFPYYLDMYFEKEKIYFEYDGSGHKLGIKFGKYTEEEFDQKELERQEFLKQKGYKEFRIISDNDIMPFCGKLLEIKDRAFLILKTYQVYIYNLNTKTESFME